MSAPPNIFGSFGAPKPTDNASGVSSNEPAKSFGSFGFGSAPNTSTSSATNPTPSFGTSSVFGAKPATEDQAKSNPLFDGGSSGGTNMFGATSSTPNPGAAVGSIPLFGNLNAGSSLSGATPNAASATQTAGDAPKPSLFGSTSTAGGGLFGGSSTSGAGGQGGGGLFGSSSAAQSTNQQATGNGNTGGSTGGGSLFQGMSKPTFGGGIFGSTAKPAGGTTTPTPTSTTPAPIPNPFGTSTPSTNPLGATPNSSTTPSTNKPPEPPKNFFGNFGAPTSGTSSGSTPTPGSGLFNKPADSNTPKPTSLFGSTPAVGDPEKKSGAIPTPSLFGTTPPGTGNKDTPAAPTAIPTGGTPNFFGGFGTTAKPAETAGEKEKKEEKPSAPPGGAPAGLFGGGFGGLPKKPDEPKDATKPPPEAPSAPTPAPGATATNAAPPSQLRGKSIEEIVSRWEQDLQTNVKEFNRVAEEVSAWDKVLIENGNYIAQLHNQVLAAESSQQLIEQTLTSVETQQQELSATLEVYEKQAKDILDGSGGALRALETGPADAARDRNYTLAAELSLNFDDLTKSLSQMIDSVNELSVSSGNEASDKGDPLTQIAEVLNEHLASLTWIDGAIGEMENKLAQVKPRLSQLNGSAMNGANAKKATPRPW